MTLNEKILQLRGKATLLDDLDRTKAYKVSCEGQIVDVREPDNEDGTFDRVYIFQIARAEVIDEAGKVTQTKDARKASQKLRAVIRREWEESQTDLTEELYYQKRMSNLMGAIIEGKI